MLSKGCILLNTTQHLCTCIFPEIHHEQDSARAIKYNKLELDDGKAGFSTYSRSWWICNVSRTKGVSLPIDFTNKQSSCGGITGSRLTSLAKLLTWGVVGGAEARTVDIHLPILEDLNTACSGSCSSNSNIRLLQRLHDKKCLIE